MENSNLKTRRSRAVSLFLTAAVLLGAFACIPFAASAASANNFTYEVYSGQAVITGYTGSSSTVVIPSTIGGYPVVAIGDEAFREAVITSVTIPAGVTTVGFAAFKACEKLTEVNLPNTLTVIEAGAFSFCTSLRNIHLPNSLKKLEYWAFDHCSALVSVTLPNGLEEIEYLAFGYCTNLTSLNIPDSVSYIEGGVVAGSTALPTLTLSPNHPYFYMEGNCLIERSTGILIQGFANSVIPNGVKAIGDEAFWNCADLKSISIPNGVLAIGSGAFRDCVKLTGIVLPDSVVSIGYGAFLGCINFTTIVIPYSVTSIDDSIFAGCNRLADIYCEVPSKPDGWSKRWLAATEMGMDDPDALDEYWETCKATVHWQTSPKLGDINWNGRIDSTDYLLLKRAVLQTFTLTDAQMAVADVTHDGKITSTDYLLLKRAVLGTFNIT